MKRLFSDIPLLQPPKLPKNTGLHWFKPPSELTPWVQCLWYAQHEGAAASAAPQTQYWDGGTSLIIRFDHFSLPVITFEALSRNQIITLRQSIDYCGIRFHPGGAFQLLKLPMKTLTGSTFTAMELKLPHIETLQSTLFDISAIRSRIELLERWLLNAARCNQPTCGVVQTALPYLIPPSGGLDDAIARVGVHRRKLERTFQEEIGVSPHKIKMLFRIKAARQMIKQQTYKSLADIAHETGFSDQPHFNHKFQQIVGQSPGQYRALRMSQKYN
jgi:AraC-like DNA-binding protein